MAGREQCASGPTHAPPSARSINFYRCLKRRLGCSLRRFHSKRRLVRARKSPTYKFPRAQSCISGLKELRASLQRPGCSDCNRQHNGGLLHQQGGRYEIRLSLCPPLETSLLVPTGKTHSGSFVRDSRQVVPSHSGDPDRVVPVSGGVQSVVVSMGPTTGRPFCDPVQSLTSKVCVSGSDSLGSGCLESAMGKSGCVRLSPSLSAQPGAFTGYGSGLLQDDSDCSRLAQHALVLGPGQSLHANSSLSSTSERSGHTAVQRSGAQESQQPESSCLAPRASIIQEQGFSDEVAARIEAPQRISTRAVYKSKWAIFVKSVTHIRRTSGHPL